MRGKNQRNINNYLQGHNFEALDQWILMKTNGENIDISCCSHDLYGNYGNHVLRMETYYDESVENGIYQFINILPAGDYTFSIFAQVTRRFTGINGGVYLRVKDSIGNILCESKHLSHTKKQYQRLTTSFTIPSAQCVNVEILADGKGVVYADGAQLENNPCVNEYNMITNGGFKRDSTYWITVGGVSVTTAEDSNGEKLLVMEGNLDLPRYAYQDISVRSERSTRETFTLSGCAKVCGKSRQKGTADKVPQFELRAEIHYKDNYYNYYKTEVVIAKFSQYIEGGWQISSVQFSKNKYRDVDFIRVYCDYSYNCGTAYFDDIQLVRNKIETGLSEKKFLKNIHKLKKIFKN